jgi:D-3-phosphoglycerate dehydrogenase
MVAVDLTLCMEALDPLCPLGQVDYLYPMDRGGVLDRLERYNAYLGHTHIKVDREFLSRGPRLRVVGTCSTGTDHIDKLALQERGIDLLSLATEYELLDRFTSVAELTWGLIVACKRRLPHEFERAKRGEIGMEPGVVPPPQLSGKTLGILGYGRLGRMVAETGKAFRMRVIACDIKPVSVAGVQQVDLDTLFEESDVLSLHVHLKPDTYHIINGETLARMKQGAILINTSRGDLVDEQALLEALESGHLDAAGLDVVHDEWDPNLADRPLLAYARTHHNLIITPHVAGGSFESVAEARIFMAKKLADYLSIQPGVAKSEE